MTQEQNREFVGTLLLKTCKSASHNAKVASEKMRERRARLKEQRGNHSCLDCRYFAAISRGANSSHPLCGAGYCMSCNDWCDKWKQDTEASKYIKENCPVPDLSTRCEARGMLQEGQSEALNTIGADIFADTSSLYTNDILLVMNKHKDDAEPTVPLVKENQILQFPAGDRKD